MAIKLADVIERTHVSYPVIEAHDKTVVGFYNGASDNAQQTVELYFNSSVKTSLSEDGTAGNPVYVTALPYLSQDGQANFVGPGDKSVVTERGGIITARDATLIADNGSIPADALTSAFLVNTARVGTASDSARDNVSRLSEIAQQFNRYTTISAQNMVAEDNTDGENFFLAGYSTANNAFRKIGFADFLQGITAQINQDLINGGLITDEQAGGTGAIGDLNNDGNVSTADLLEFLSNFGQNNNGYATDYITMSGGSETSALFTPGANPDDTSTFGTSDVTTWAYPSSYSVSGDAYGWASVSATTGAANSVTLNDIATGTAGALFSNHWLNRKLVVEVAFQVTFNGPDVVFPLLHVTLTGDDSAETTQECIYATGYQATLEASQQGIYSEGFFGLNGGTVVGIPTLYAVVFDIGEGATARHVIADNYENHSSDLADGFHFDYELSSGVNIEDLNMKTYFTSLGQNADVKVFQVRHRIIQV